MSLLPHHQSLPSDPEGLLNAISELEQNQKANVKARRTNNRMELDCDVVVLPGNASQRDGKQFEGSCRDISPQGCRLVLKSPITVGDVFFVSIDDPQNRFDPIYGRCVRCVLIREDVFEVGINFFAPISFKEIEGTQSADLDLDLN